MSYKSIRADFLRSEIKKYCNLTGETQLQLANKLGVSFPTFRNWATGATVPNKENLQKLLPLLNLDQKYEELILNESPRIKHFEVALNLDTLVKELEQVETFFQNYDLFQLIVHVVYSKFIKENLCASLTIHGEDPNNVTIYFEYPQLQNFQIILTLNENEILFSYYDKDRVNQMLLTEESINYLIKLMKDLL